MKGKFFLGLSALIVVILLGFLLKNQDISQSLVSPSKDISTRLEVTPTPTPVEFNFDRSTDLEKELEQVKPQIKSSDFEPLEKLIDSL